MAFDADAFVAALEPPTLTAGGRTYRGRLLSAVQWLRLHEEKARLTRAAEEATTPAAAAAVEFMARRLTERTVAAFFPRRWWQLRSPALAAYRRLPPAAQLAALADFSECQRRAMPSAEGVTPAPDAPGGPLAAEE